jgi:hypothetical protein
MTNKNTDKDLRINKLLQQRRQSGGCSMWKKIGIKYLGDNEMFDKMLDSEIQYYFKYHKKNKDII